MTKMTVINLNNRAEIFIDNRQTKRLYASRIYTRGREMFERSPIRM